MKEMECTLEAYLDIETTGLSAIADEITVIGIHLCRGMDTKLIQLVGTEITAHTLLKTLENTQVIYTYNGSRFDLPFIQTQLWISLKETFTHRDLMYDCWQHNLYGGFKAAERQLGIERKLTEVNGYEAIRLWWRYVNNYDKDALAILLEYNKEDVINLKTLKEKLL